MVSKKINSISVRVIAVLSVIFLVAVMFFDVASATRADYSYENPDTGHRVFIEDEAGLFSREEEIVLSYVMEEVTNYGDVVLATTYSNSSSVRAYAQSCSERHFTDGVTFLIDMGNRYIYIDSMGTMRGYVNSSDATTITDNVYRYASNGNYLYCAVGAFQDIIKLCQGRRIARPMKYICTGVLALFISLLVAYFWAYSTSTVRKASNRTILENLAHYCLVTNIFGRKTASVRIYSPRSSSGGGHGGGGGGHSGGGHSF